MRGPVIAIDGPAASGKSSTAAAVARALGYLHVDSGALYRALTWVAVHQALDDPREIAAAAAALHVEWRSLPPGLTVHVDGVDDIDAAIRSAAVNANVSAVAAMPLLRDWVNARIRAVIARLPGVVIDGRDIGTVVVPDAELKVYLTAAAATRAERRLAQRGRGVDPGELAAETATLAERDRRDAGRETAPLRQPTDAVRLDTTTLTLPQQVARIVALAAERGLLPLG